MEEENKTRKSLIIIICILAVIVVSLGVFIGIKEFSRKNNPTNNINDDVEEKSSLVGNYIAQTDDGKYFLYIRDNKVFRLAQANSVVTSVGTYEVDDEDITFSEKIKYGNDDGCVLCYYTNHEMTKDYEMKLDGNKLIYNNYIFEKTNSILELEQDLAWYVLNPTENNNPKDVIDEWEGYGWDHCDDANKEYYQYKSLFKETSNLVIDYDIKTSKKDIPFKTVYDLVIAESTKNKKSSNVNLYDYVGRVKMLNDEYAYVNYDVAFYNLPKDVYDKNVEQLKQDKLEKVYECKQDECSLKSTSGYEAISKYLVKNSFYYYVLKDGKKVETRTIMDSNYVKNQIPDEWLSLGSYKTKDAMYKDVLIMVNEAHKYENYLVVYDTGNDIKLRYKGKTKSLADSSNYSEEAKKLYSKSEIISKADYFTTVSKKATINKKEVTLSIKFYRLKEYDKELNEYNQRYYYDVFFNDKKVINAEKNEVYELFYDDCDEDDCSSPGVATIIKDVKVIVDNNKKEYAILDVFGYSPIGGEELFIINSDGKLILDMEASVNYGFATFTGDGSGKYIYKDSYESFHLWEIKNDKIYYIELEDEDTCEKVRFYEHVVTINDGKVSDKKTNSIFKGNSLSGGCPDRIYVKAY